MLKKMPKAISSHATITTSCYVGATGNDSRNIDRQRLPCCKIITMQDHYCGNVARLFYGVVTPLSTLTWFIMFLFQFQGSIYSHKILLEIYQGEMEIAHSSLNSLKGICSKHMKNMVYSLLKCYKPRHAPQPKVLSLLWTGLCCESSNTVKCLLACLLESL